MVAIECVVRAGDILGETPLWCDRWSNWSKGARFRAAPSADAATCRRYYEQNRQRFRSPDIYEPAHILFAASKAHAPGYAQARSAAQAVLAVLREHPERFAELAQAHSACASASQGGNLGQITAGQTTPEFEQALFALEPGTIGAEPVATRYGFHIVRVDRRHAGRELPFELVADRIAAYLEECVQRRALAQYVARLAAAGIEGIEPLPARRCSRSTILRSRRGWPRWRRKTTCPPANLSGSRWGSSPMAQATRNGSR